MPLISSNTQTTSSFLKTPCLTASVHAVPLAWNALLPTFGLENSFIFNLSPNVKISSRTLELFLPMLYI